MLEANYFDYFLDVDHCSHCKRSVYPELYVGRKYQGLPFIFRAYPTAAVGPYRRVLKSAQQWIDFVDFAHNEAMPLRLFNGITLTTVARLHSDIRKFLFTQKTTNRLYKLKVAQDYMDAHGMNYRLDPDGSPFVEEDLFQWQ